MDLAVFDAVFSFFAKGGVFMVFLLALSVVALTVVILRGTALRYETVIPLPIQQRVMAYQPGGDLTPVTEVAEKDESPLGRIVYTLLTHLHNSRAETLEAVQTRARQEVARMETGLVILEITTGVAPLFGLLGTLSGLVGIFANLNDAGDPTLVARGIAEALNTTIVGLGVAAPSLIAYNYFVRKIEVMSIQMEAITADLLEKIYLGARSGHEV